MRKKYFMLSTILLIVLLVSSSCVHSNDKVPTISVNADSEYVTTFVDLNLSVLYDFDFKLTNVDESWVRVWVESYRDGKKESEPMIELSYGLSPNEVEEGNLGFGILNPTTDVPLVFLYAPSVTVAPEEIEKINIPNRFSGWDYAIGEDEVALKLNEPYLLGAYRQSAGDSITTYDLRDEEQVKKMIEKDHVVFLLKIEEKNEIVK